MLEVNVFDIAVNIFWLNWLHVIHWMCAFAQVLDVKVCVWLGNQFYVLYI